MINALKIFLLATFLVVVALFGVITLDSVVDPDPPGPLSSPKIFTLPFPEPVPAAGE